MEQGFRSPQFWYTFGPHEPAIRLADGGSIRVICPDSDNQLSDGHVLSETERGKSAGSSAFQGNPMAGPIAIDGAMPGDVLAVTINAIELDCPTGQTGLAPNHGLLAGHQLDSSDTATVPQHLYRWHIDPVAGIARLLNPLGPHSLEVPLKPFIGCIGVCPPPGQSISTLFAGSHGGNMDIPALAPGATLYLPVNVEGGLLMMGDIHAAQGHGEIIGGGIETSGTIDCTIRVIRGKVVNRPRLRDATQLMAIASDGDLRTAIQLAYSDLLNWLAANLHMNRSDAYNLLSQTGSITIGNLVTSPYTVGASIPNSVLPMEALQNLEGDGR